MSLADIKSILIDRLQYTVNDIMIRYNARYHLPDDLTEDYSGDSSAITFQCYIDDIQQRVYVYMLIDSNFRISNADDVEGAYCYIARDLERYVPNYLGRGYRVMVLGPGNKYTRNRSHAINQNIRVTPNTFTCWKSLNGNYEFIEDKVSIVKLLSKELPLNIYKEESRTWKKQILDGLKEINNTYEFKNNPDNSEAVYDAFTDLKELYTANCGVNLKMIDEEDVFMVYLLHQYD